MLHGNHPNRHPLSGHALTSPGPLALSPLLPPLRSFFGGSQEAGYQRFRTTTQNFFAYDTKALSVGESNQGIVSEKSKIIHQKQTM